MRIILFIINRPLVILIAVILVIFSGSYAVMHMPVDLFPNLDVPIINIVTHLPAGTPEDMELLITRPVEEQIRTIPAVRRVSSTCARGLSLVTVEFAWGTSVTNARQLVQAKLARLRSTLPPGVTPRLENIGTTLQEVAGYIIYGGSDLLTLRTIAQYDLANRLMEVEGVSLVDVIGGDLPAYNIEIPGRTLLQTQLTVSDIASALRKNNLSATAGYIERSGRDYLIRADGKLKTVKDIRSVPVTTGSGRPILLGSIARISQGKVPRHFTVYGDTRPAIAIVIRKQPGADTIGVVHNIDTALKDMRRLLPSNTVIKKYYDQSEIIAESRNAILHNLLIGMLLAVLVLYFFLGSLRPTLIVALTIPISILAAMAVMSLAGLSLNVITMTALALAVGMIVDDAIVVTENIHRKHLAGLDTIKASVLGTAEIAAPDAAGTFTTVAAFTPLVLVTGLAAIFLKPFGFTISVALLASLLLSLTMVPAMLAGKSQPPPTATFLGARLLDVLNRALQPILEFSFKHKALVIVLNLLFFSTTALLIFMGKVSILPPIDEGALMIEYIMPPGTSLSESNRIGNSLDKIALALPEVATVYRRTGSPPGGYQIEGVTRGEIAIKLKPRSQRQHTAAEILAHLKKIYSRYDGVVFLFHQPTQEKIDDSFTGLPALFGVTIYGTDLDTLASLSRQVEAILSQDASISNIVNNTKIKTAEIDIHFDYEKLARYGLNSEDVLATVQAAQYGFPATRITRQKQTATVILKIDAEPITDIRQLKQVPIYTQQGKIVPLERIADIRIVHVPAAITRLDGRRELTIMAEVEGNIISVIRRLRSRFSTISLPAGYSIDFTGQYKVVIKTTREIILVLLAAVALIYLIMVMQFHSWLQPLLILLTIPLALTGAVIALFITGQGLDVSVAIGVVTLAGISVNNAIVLLDLANRQKHSGKNTKEALLDAAAIRLRPILLTTLTTIFALVPTAIGSLVGSRIFQPFAITVIGGLVSGTAATLIILPTLVTLLPKQTPAHDTHTPNA